MAGLEGHVVLRLDDYFLKQEQQALDSRAGSMAAITALLAQQVIVGPIVTSDDRMTDASAAFFSSDVIARLADSLPASYKLRVLDEKHVLKRVAKGVVPREILERKKQPYRAPDAVSFVGPDAPAWVADLLSPAALKEAGMFDAAAGELLYRKCREGGNEASFSNADNMALVGMISMQLLHERFVRRAPETRVSFELSTLVQEC
jgi:asparagine synthetase B (glutamine-hydrolysing)